MKTISIIIPVYKAEKYIERCLSSVINQSYPAELIECVIVNDCTPDNSMDIINRFIAEYKGAMQFSIVCHETNMGASTARNSGINVATGQYLLFIDSDDHITSECVTILVNGIEKYNTDVAIGNIYIHVSNCYHHNTDSAYTITGQENIEKEILNMTSAAFPVNKIVSRKLIIDNKIYFQPGIIYEDLLWNLMLSKHLNSIVFLPENTYSYENNEDSTLSNAQTDKKPSAISFLTILKQSINIANYSCIIEYHLFSLHFALELLDCIHNHKVKNVTMDDFRPLRSTIMRQAKSISLLCYIVSLIMYKPFWYIFNTRIFKNHRVDIRFRLRDIMNKKRHTI